MKIIRPAPGKDWTYRFTCATCGAELEADPKDVKSTQSHERNGVTETFTVECPECRRDNLVDDTRIPAIVRDAARKRRERIGVRS